MKTRFLFLLSEGFDETVIDSQVVDSVVALRAAGVEFDILALSDGRAWWTKRAYYAERRRMIAARTGGVVRLRPLVRRDRLVGRWLAELWLLATLGPSGLRRTVIHARGAWAAAIAGRIARRWPGVSVVFDCRGDGEAEYAQELLSRGTPPGALLEAELAPIRATHVEAVARADRVLAVSEPLRDLLVTRYGVSPELCRVVPCAADETKFRPDEAERAETRRALGIEDRFVVIFPGRLGRWHWSEETFAAVAGVLNAHPDAFFQVLTPDVEEAEALGRRLLPDHRWNVRSAAHSEVPRFLRAADLGMLLREQHPINAVACPTKFAEFVMTGLPVLISPEIGDCSRFVVEQRAGAVLERPEPDVAAAVVTELRAEPAGPRRARIAAAGRARFSRQAYATSLAEFYESLGGRSRES